MSAHEIPPPPPVPSRLRTHARTYHTRGGVYIYIYTSSSSSSSLSSSSKRTNERMNGMNNWNGIGMDERRTLSRSRTTFISFMLHFHTPFCVWVFSMSHKCPTEWQPRTRASKKVLEETGVGRPTYPDIIWRILTRRAFNQPMHGTALSRCGCARARTKRNAMRRNAMQCIGTRAPGQNDEGNGTDPTGRTDGRTNGTTRRCPAAVRPSSVPLWARARCRCRPT